jgi:hypothetical protein
MHLTLRRAGLGHSLLVGGISQRSRRQFQGRDFTREAVMSRFETCGRRDHAQEYDFRFVEQRS